MENHLKWEELLDKIARKSLKKDIIKKYSCVKEFYI